MKFKKKMLHHIEIIIDNHESELCGANCPQFFGFPHFICGLFASKLQPPPDPQYCNAYRCDKCLEYMPININIFLPINDLHLTARNRNVLFCHNIHYVWQLVTLKESQLIEWKKFGKISLNRLKDALSELALYLGFDEDTIFQLIILNDNIKKEFMLPLDNPKTDQSNLLHHS